MSFCKAEGKIVWICSLYLDFLFLFFFLHFFVSHKENKLSKLNQNHIARDPAKSKIQISVFLCEEFQLGIIF